MKWFRNNVKHGSRLALLALAIQFVLSFGHFHAVAAPAVSISQAQADFAASGAASEAAQQTQPSNHDTDQPTEPCAICAVISLANTLVSPAPPLLLPQAAEFLYLTTDADFAHLNSVHPAFQSRAPPVS